MAAVTEVPGAQRHRAAMATTARGHIEQLPSGSFRVHAYSGTDPVTGKPRRLKQTCPDEASAAALGKLLAQADGDHFPTARPPSARPSPGTWKSPTSRYRPGRRGLRSPHPRKREPDPPSPDQAARLLNLVWVYRHDGD